MYVNAVMFIGIEFTLRRVRLPPTDPSEEEEDLDKPPTRASTRMTRYTVDVPKAAKAGLVGEMAERLDDIQDEVERVKPVSQAWNAIGDIYIGCQGGQLIKVSKARTKNLLNYTTLICEDKIKAVTILHSE